MEDSNGSKYVTLVPIDKNKDLLKKNEEIWNITEYLIKSKNNNSYNCD